jgi:DNA-binding GntR family transcriptional regulator
VSTPSVRILRHVGTKQQALERFLREEIARGRIKPGTRLKQQDLARRFGMSPTPVRETLRRLEGDGLVLYAPNRGIRVAQVDYPEVEEVYLMRMALESLAVRSAAARLTAEDLSALGHLQDRMDRAIAQGRLKTLRNLNYDFHMAIYSRAGYHRLLQIIRALWGLFPWDTLQVIPGRAKTSMREHHAILRGLRNGDGPAAADRMRAHVARSFADLRTYLTAARQNGRENLP